MNVGLILDAKIPRNGVEPIFALFPMRPVQKSVRPLIHGQPVATVLGRHALPEAGIVANESGFIDLQIRPVAATAFIAASGIAQTRIGLA